MNATVAALVALIAVGLDKNLEITAIKVQPGSSALTRSLAVCESERLFGFLLNSSNSEDYGAKAQT